MIKSFAPSFQHFQKDIERFLKSEGKCEKNEHVQMVYRGYQAAVDQMFHAYLAQEAFAPLVDEFRKWNWEWDYESSEGFPGQDLRRVSDENERALVRCPLPVSKLRL